MSPSDGYPRGVALAGGLSAGLIVFLLFAGPLVFVAMASAGNDMEAEVGESEAVGPERYLGNEEAIAEGEATYRQRCIGCHFRAGGRGPNIFRTTLTPKQFLNTVMNGRRGMPPWKGTLTEEEVWEVYALVMSRDRL